MYYVKQSLFPFLYLIFMAIIAAGIGMINSVWAQVLLYLLNLAFYVFLMVINFFKEGQTALKVRHANDVERMQIIKTGDALPLKLREEYKPWKGFFIGFITALPLLFCLLLHLILILCAGEAYTGAGTVASLLYLVFFAPYSVAFSNALSAWQYFILLYAVPLMMVITGVPYVLGARKIQNQYDRIEQKQRQIYGDK